MLASVVELKTTHPVARREYDIIVGLCAKKQEQDVECDIILPSLSAVINGKT